MAKITIDLPAELLNSIDERCGNTTPLVSRNEFIHLALAEYLRIDEATKEKERLFWAREETEEELNAWVEQASMEGLREFYKDEPPWPHDNK